MSKQPKVILSGGGTGGHIYPAVAIANEIKHRYPEADILFVGAKDRMEMQKVPKAGYPIKGLWISGIQRKLTLKNLMFPLKLISSLIKSRSILNQFMPDIVIGTGGFASGPLLKMANVKKIPTVLQEQNSFPGITNKWLAKEADVICVAYDGLQKFFPKEKIIKTGNPVRQGLLQIASKREESIAKFSLDKTKKTILIIGGSLGARRINKLIEEQLNTFRKLDVQLIWQCGSLYYEEYKQYNQKENVQVHAFLDEMDKAYAASDIIISRAGAGSVSELCIVGKPVLFIPSPNVAEDHQTKNAMAIVNADGALMIRESELEQKFEEEFTKLIQSESTQREISEAIQKLALPDATLNIVNEVERLIK